MVTSAHVRRGALGLAAALLVLVLAGGVLSRGGPVSAADAETAQLISYMNGYRASLGVAGLQTSSQLNSEAQSVATQVAVGCNYGAMYGTGHTTFGSYSYPDAESLWAAWQQDPVYLSYIGKAKYKSVGVGRGYGTCFNPMWVIMLETDPGDGSPPPGPTNTPSGTISHPTATPSGGATATPSGTFSHPTATPTGQPTITPTATPVPSGTLTTTPTSTGVPTDTPTSDPTPALPLWGDGDCDGAITSWDGILMLMLISDYGADLDCLPDAGFDCAGGVDLADVFALLEYLSGLPGEPNGDDCPDIGDPAPTITPAPTDTPSGSPTATPTPTPTPSGEPTATPNAAEANHCFLAMVAYQLTSNQGMSGAMTCTPDTGAAYFCNFDNVGHTAVCAPGAQGFASYSCDFTGSVYALCEGSSGAASYECYNDAGVVSCDPTIAGQAEFDCATSEQTVACASFVAPYPDFFCTKGDTGFACELAQTQSGRRR